MLVKKFQNGNIHMKLDSEEILQVTNDLRGVNRSHWFGICELDDLFWNDLRVDYFGTEWLYLIDDNKALVYMINSYGWNNFEELLTGKTVIFTPCGTTDDEEYKEEC